MMKNQSEVRVLSRAKRCRSNGSSFTGECQTDECNSIIKTSSTKLQKVLTCSSVWFSHVPELSEIDWRIVDANHRRSRGQLRPSRRGYSAIWRGRLRRTVPGFAVQPIDFLGHSHMPSLLRHTLFSGFEIQNSWMKLKRKHRRRSARRPLGEDGRERGGTYSQKSLKLMYLINYLRLKSVFKNPM